MSRGGTYAFSGTTGSHNAVLFNKSGTSSKPIRYFAYQNETPVFDFFNYKPQERVRGFSVQADYLHFRGLEVRGVQQVLQNVNESWASAWRTGRITRLRAPEPPPQPGPGLFIAEGGDNRHAAGEWQPAILGLHAPRDGQRFD